MSFFPYTLQDTWDTWAVVVFDQGYDFLPSVKKEAGGEANITNQSLIEANITKSMYGVKHTISIFKLS